MMNSPPTDWNDKGAWDRYFNAELLAGRTPTDPDFIVLRFLTFVHDKGGRIWFSGCGLDHYPKAYAARGCKVLATDLSSVAIKYQQQVAMAFMKEGESTGDQSTFAVMEHDFTRNAPRGVFDVVVNCRAFQGLSPDGMRAAAGCFYAALRPGGAAIIDTMNVQGKSRDLIENCLTAAGFYMPFQTSERWYRQQLNDSGIIYEMVLGRPHIPYRGQYPREQVDELAKRDRQILDSFQAEYKRRCQEEAADVAAMVDDPSTIVAHVVYATG